MFDVVLVWKLDRFSRDRYDSARYKAQLKKNSVKVISATEKIEDNSSGILLESVLKGYAEYFSADLSEKVIRGMTENALKCQYNGGCVPLGFVIDKEKHYQIDPVTAPLMLEAFKQYANGETVKEVVNYFKEKGIKSNNNADISFNMVTRILKNRKYIGEYAYRDVIVPDSIPLIVPKDLFNKVQELRRKNKKAPARRKAEDHYLLTTKLFCGYCGAFMVGECGTSKNGKTHRYYKCITAKRKHTCKKKSVQKELIENAVIAQIQRLIYADEIVEKMIQTVMELQKTESTTLPLLKKQLKETQKSIDNMLNAIQQGVFTSSAKERLEELEETKNPL